MAATLYSFVNQNDDYLHTSDEKLLNEITGGITVIKPGETIGVEPNRITVDEIAIETFASSGNGNPINEAHIGKSEPIMAQMFLYCHPVDPINCQLWTEEYRRKRFRG